MASGDDAAGEMKSLSLATDAGQLMCFETRWDDRALRPRWSE